MDCDIWWIWLSTVIKYLEFAATVSDFEFRLIFYKEKVLLTLIVAYVQHRSFELKNKKLKNTVHLLIHVFTYSLTSDHVRFLECNLRILRSSFLRHLENVVNFSNPDKSWFPLKILGHWIGIFDCSSDLY